MADRAPKKCLGLAKTGRVGGWLRLGLMVGVTAAASYAQCTFTVNPTPVYADSTAQTVVVQVTASAQTCGWSAAGNGFATVSGTTGTGTGNGSVSYNLTANTTGADRTAPLAIAGNTVNLTQRFTAQVFSDVDLGPSSPYFDGANLLRTNDITAGCQASPLLYCPDQNVTRGQMAIFIVRTVLGGGATVDNFTYSATPYFTDVPVTHPYFKWIQKLRDMGVTGGCSVTTYCPDANIPRNQMAIFIIRARLGSTATFTFNPTPYFTDEPATDTTYFKYIQKLKEIGVTAGCTATTYCPNDLVTRGQMAIFLVRAGFNDLLGGTAPLISSVSPNSGKPGTSVTVAVTGINTNFAQGQTTVTVAGGVTAGTPTVTSATQLTVTLTIPTSTQQGPVSLTAVTPLNGGTTEQATIPNGFLVGLGDPLPTISGFTPVSGPIGTSVTLSGTTLVSSAGTPADVRMVAQGGGIVSAPLTASTTGSLTFVVPSTAATGIITVSASSGNATTSTLTPSVFTVTPSSTFTLSAAPTTANVIAGQTGTYTVSVASGNGFPGLAALSLTGLPAGLSASFVPAAVAAGGQSTLTITAPAGQKPSSTSLVIGAAATVDGIAESISTGVTLNVQAVTTSFIGRTVVDDGKNTALAGVTVTMLGLDGSGNKTPCTGQTISDGSGNFALTQLAAGCIGPQLVGFGGNSVTSPPGTYAGVNLVFTLVSGQVVVSPVLVHLPRIDNVETFLVTQNAQVDQSYAYKTIPGLKVTVYAGTVFTEADGTQPNPFPLAAINVPVDRLPDVMPATTATVNAFIVAFQPANTNSSKPVAVWFPNTLNTAPGTDVPLTTLDPTRGRMVPYGTGTVSSDGTTIVPDIDPSTGSLQHRYGIVHFDWHGPAVAPPPTVNPPCDKCPPTKGEPIDLSSGIEVLTSTDLVLNGNRGSVAIVRTYRTLSNQLRAFGLGASFNYDYRLDTLAPQNAAVVNLELPNGTRVPFNQQPDGTLVNTTAPPMAGAVLKPASDGSAVLRFKTGAYFQFQPGNFLTNSVITAIGDPNGNVIQIVRNPSIPQQITEIDDPVGRKLTLAWNSNNNITSITDPIGRVASYTYNSTFTLATFTDVLGGITKYSYDSQNRLVTVTDPRGIVQEQNTFDANGRVISQVTPSGGTIQFAYTPINSLVPTSPIQQTVVTDQLGNATTYRFNTQGYVVGVSDASGQTRTIDRAAGTNLILSMTGPGTCDVCGDTTAGDITSTYDANGNVLTQTDSLGNTWSFTYDSIFSNILVATDPVGNVLKRTYDTSGNLIQVTDARGNSAAFTRDATGLITAAQDTAGNITKFAYDSLGNLVSVSNPLNQKTLFSYDGASRITAQLDPLGRTSSVTYNPGDAPLTLVDGNGHSVQFTYDIGGYPTSYADSKGGKTTIAYDAAGRVSTRTDPLNRAMTYQYDLDSNLVGFTNRRGQAAVYTYDALNRVVTETYVDAMVQRTFDSTGRVIRVVDSQAGSFNVSYDGAGRLLKVVSPNGTITYTRDADGRVLTRQVSGQPVVTYTYDANGNMTSAAMGNASVSRTYDARNLLTGNTRRNGVTGSYTFDAVGRILTISEQTAGSTLFSRAFTYDAAGQITGNTLDTGLALSTPSSTGTFDAANEISSFGGTTYTSDADGNRLTEKTTAGTTSYVWDARGRLQAIQAPGSILTSFVYDPAGQMIQKRVTSTGNDDVQRYILDDALNIVSAQNASGVTSILDGRRPDDIVATVAGGSPVFPLGDQLGSEGALTDVSGNVIGREFYEPFGAPTTTGTVGLFQFTGHPLVNAGVYYSRARFYDSNTGRFLSEDPIGASGRSANPYAYVNGNPISLIDPLGLTPTLSYKTLSGGADQATWQIQWNLSKPSQSGGWIVQQIDAKDAAGNTTTYWEAWQVSPNSSVTTYAAKGDPNDDLFRGWSSINGSARFYEGLTLPAGFVPNSNNSAGILPATSKDPNLDCKNASPAVNRSWKPK
jgi:RHS repeat-associated protein